MSPSNPLTALPRIQHAAPRTRLAEMPIQRVPRLDPHGGDDGILNLPHILPPPYNTLGFLIHTNTMGVCPGDRKSLCTVDDTYCEGVFFLCEPIDLTIFSTLSYYA